MSFVKKSKSENNFLAKLFRSCAFPTAFQIVGLIIYLALIWFAVGIDVQKGISPTISIRNNISSLIIWGIWLPLLIIVTAFLGRLWCAVCPLELVQQMGNYLGKKVFRRFFKMPVFFRNGMVAVVLFALLHFLLIAVRYPQVTGNSATLLAALLLFSFFISLFFGNRVFCKYFCPANMLIGLIGRRSMLKLVHKKNNINANQESFINSCPSKLNPKSLKDSSECTLCAKCVKANKSMNPVLRPMPIIPNDSVKEYKGAMLMAFVLWGFVLEHIFHGWEAGNRYYGYLPQLVKSSIGIKALGGWIEAVWAMIVIPSVFLLIITVVGKIVNGRLKISEIWERATLPSITIVTGLYLGLSLHKFNEWVVHFGIALENLKNQLASSLLPESFFLLKIHQRGNGMHKHDHGAGFLPDGIWMGIALVFSFLFLYFAFKEIYKFNKYKHKQ